MLAFAVSPDDRRIAVSLLDYTRYPVGTRLFVEDLNGHGNHVELFSSTSTKEWPAGWHKGRLVMALGINVPPQNVYEGFSYGHGYHIADAGTGNRLLSLCDGGDSYIPESPAGTVCVQYPNAAIVSWDGVTRAVPKAGTCPTWGPMSPNGTMASRTISPPGGGCTAGSSVFLINSAGVVNSASLAPLGSPEGWIDVNHLMLVADVPPFASPDFQPSQTIVDVTSGTTAGFTAPGFFGAALPGGL